MPLSKIESGKKIVSCHSRKSRVEREMGTIKFLRSREKFLFLLSIFLSRARLSSMCDSVAGQLTSVGPVHQLYSFVLFSQWGLCVQYLYLCHTGIICWHPEGLFAFLSSANLQSSQHTKMKAGQASAWKSLGSIKEASAKKKAWTRQPPRPPCQPSYQGQPLTPSRSLQKVHEIKVFLPVNAFKFANTENVILNIFVRHLSVNFNSITFTLESWEWEVVSLK